MKISVSHIRDPDKGIHGSWTCFLHTQTQEAARVIGCLPCKDLDCILGSQFWPGQVWAIVGIWGMTQWIGSTQSLSNTYKMINKFQMIIKLKDSRKFSHFYTPLPNLMVCLDSFWPGFKFYKDSKHIWLTLQSYHKLNPLQNHTVAFHHL